MRTIEKALSKLDKYLYLIRRDTEKGWYVLEVGIPVAWTHKSSNKVTTEELGSTEKMKMIQINPNEEYKGEVSIDDLLDYATQIVSNNKKIEKMREDFEKKMGEIREKLEEEYEKFEDEIENMIGEGLEDNEDLTDNDNKPAPKKPEKKLDSEIE
jgi:hypothetical protein